MDPLIRLSALTVLGALIFVGSLWLPWEGYRGVMLGAGWRVVSLLPVLPYAPVFGAAVGAAGALLGVFNLVSARILKLILWIGFLLLLLGRLASLYQLDRLLSDGFESVERGGVGSVGAIIGLAGMRKMAKR